MAGSGDEAAGAKLRKADEFLLMAEMALEMDAFDAAASLAVSAAINGSDFLLMKTVGSYASGEDHRQAVTLLRVHGHVPAATQLSRVLGLKNKAQYSPQRCARKEAEDAILRASRLLETARGAL